MMRKMQLVVLFAALLLLPACFDYQADFVLHEDGSGSAAFSLQVVQGTEVDWQDPMVRRIFSPEPLSQEFVRNDFLILQEQTDFENLNSLQLSRMGWQLRVQDTGVLGLTAYTYRLTTTILGAENIAQGRSTPPGYTPQPSAANRPVDEAGIKAQLLRARAAQDHAIVINQTLPGPVQEADKIILGAYVVEPQIDGNKVSWRLPLSMLIDNDVRHNLVFSCSFKGSYSPSVRDRRFWVSQISNSVLPPARPVDPLEQYLTPITDEPLPLVTDASPALVADESSLSVAEESLAPVTKKLCWDAYQEAQ